MANVFLSYRRDGGEALAEILYIKLTERGYDVFYDKESLRSGIFEPKLYTEIERCDDFVLILPPRGLDRCLDNENDWVRCEIRRAIACGKNIVPIIMRGFSFPTHLPDDIRDVSSFNGVPFENMEFIDARVDRITQLMVCEPTRRRRRRHRKAGDRGHSGGLTVLRKLLSPARKLFGLVWDVVPLRIVFSFVLSIACVSVGIDVVRDIRNTNVDQWITPKYLIVDNPYLNNISVSVDNKWYAVNDGQGTVTIYQTSDNQSEIIAVSEIQTGITGRASVGFSDDKNLLYVIGKREIEVFDAHYGLKYGTYSLENSVSGISDPDSLVAYDLIFRQDQGICTVFWMDPAENCLKECALYDMNDGYKLLHSVAIDGYFHLGTAAERYYLMQGPAKEFMIIDRVEGACYIEPDINKIKENSEMMSLLQNQISGQIDTNYNTDEKTYFNGAGTHMVYCFNRQVGTDNAPSSDVMILDLSTGETMFNETYVSPLYFTFESDGCFAILSWFGGKMELRRVYYQDQYEKKEPVPDDVLLTEDEITRLFMDGESTFFAMHLIPDTDTVVVTNGYRIHLVDLVKKRRTASSNLILDEGFKDRYILGSGITSWRGQIIVTVVTTPESDADPSIPSSLTALRFSYLRDGRDILIREDAYAEERKVDNRVILGLLVLVTVLFWGFGRRRSRQRERACPTVSASLRSEKTNREL